jgi:transposase
MGYRKIDNSTHAVAVRLRNCGRDMDSEIAKLCDFSEHTLRQTLARISQTGSADLPKVRGCGRPRKVTPGDVQYLLGLASFKLSFFLCEYANLLSEN